MELLSNSRSGRVSERIPNARIFKEVIVSEILESIQVVEILEVENQETSAFAVDFPILAQERQRAVQTTDQQVVWTIHSTLRSEELNELLQLLQSCKGSELRKLPSFQARFSVGRGVFSALVNNLFEYIIEDSGILELNGSDSPCLTFVTLSHSAYQFKARYYHVLGKMLYWFVIIHELIHFPFRLDPVITAYAIYGYIPDSLIPTPNMLRTMATIRQYSSDVDENLIGDEVRLYIEEAGISFEDFLRLLRNSVEGGTSISRLLSTTIIVGRNIQAFELVREGFNYERGFESVCSVEKYSDLKILSTIDFESLRAYFLSVITTPEEIIQTLRWHYSGTLPNPIERRTKSLLETWVRTSDIRLGCQFIRCITGSTALTPGLRPNVDNLI